MFTTEKNRGGKSQENFTERNFNFNFFNIYTMCVQLFITVLKILSIFIGWII